MRLGLDLEDPTYSSLSLGCSFMSDINLLSTSCDLLLGKVSPFPLCVGHYYNAMLQVRGLSQLQVVCGGGAVRLGNSDSETPALVGGVGGILHLGCGLVTHDGKCYLCVHLYISSGS